MIEDRWIGLVLSLWMLGCAGMAGSFALYSPLLKELGNYDQKRVGALAAAKDLGEALGIIPGLLCDVFPPWVLLLIGSSQFLLGFGLLWLVCSNVISLPSFSSMFIILLLASQGTAWFNTATLVTNVRNFPKSRGTVVGLLKSLVGLSSAIYAQVYFTLLAPNASSFLGLLASLPVAIAFPCMTFLRPAHRRHDDTMEKESVNLKYLMVSSLCLALYLSLINIVQELMPLPQQVKFATLAGMVAFLLVDLVVPVSYWRKRGEEGKAGMQTATEPETRRTEVREGGMPSSAEITQPLLKRSESVDSIYFDFSPKSSEAFSSPFVEPAPSKQSLTHADSENSDKNKDVEAASCNDYSSLPAVPEILSSSVPSVPTMLSTGDEDLRIVQLRRRTPMKRPGVITRRRSSNILLAVSEGAVRQSRKKGPRRGEDFTLSQAIVKADYWLLALGFMIGCGTALTAINNLAQMAKAQGYDRVRMFVSLVSIWSFVGRLAGGYLSEELVKRFALPRPIMLLSAQLLMCIGHICFAWAFGGSLHIGCIIIGICYGVHWSVMPATVSELFGLQNFGILFNMVAITMPLGSLLFSSLIAGTLYDMEVDKQLHRLPHVPFNLWWTVTDAEAKDCTGPQCFRITFICMFAACLIGCILNSVLVSRTRSVYKTLYKAQEASAFGPITK